MLNVSQKTIEKHCLYGLCPICGERGVSRERRLNGDDACVNGHVYPSANAVLEHLPKAKQKEIIDALEEVKTTLGDAAKTIGAADEDLMRDQAVRVLRGSIETVKGAMLLVHRFDSHTE